MCCFNHCVEERRGAQPDSPAGPRGDPRAPPRNRRGAGCRCAGQPRRSGQIRVGYSSVRSDAPSTDPLAQTSMRWLVLAMVRLYQRTLSFDHGPMKFFFPDGFCRFYPTCSAYGHESISRHGMWRGSGLMFWRICRCHPWSKGGTDPVPEK